MSSDKQDKNSGNRHKARECALQMLFASDFAGSNYFSNREYWAELGLEQLHKGIVELIESFVELLDKNLRSLNDLRVLIKDLDLQLGRRSSLDRLKEVEALNNRVRSAYQKFIDDFLDVKDRDLDDVNVLLTEADRGLQKVFKEVSENTLDYGANESSKIENFKTLINLVSENYSTLKNNIFPEIDELLTALIPSRKFADRLALGTIENLIKLDDRIRTRAEHWRIERMAIVDRNVLRMAVYEFMYEDTPATVAINEALEIARRFSTFEATQFINGILDAIKQDITSKAGENGTKSRKSKASAK